VQTGVGSGTLFPEGSYRLYWRSKVGDRQVNANFEVLINHWVRIIGSAGGGIGSYWKWNDPFITSEANMTQMRNKIIQNITTLTRNIEEW
jgi:hypothetical protein